MPENIILTHLEIEHKIKRISYQIYETFVGEKEIVIAGIYEKGYIFAEKLAENVEKISDIKVILCEVHANKQNPFDPITTSLSKSEYENKGLILVLE